MRVVGFPALSTGHLYPPGNIPGTHFCWGTAEAQWLRCCATNRKVAGSIPAGVIDIKFFRSRYGLGVDSGSNRNEYQELFLGLRPVSKADSLTTLLCRCHEIWEP